MTTIYLSVLLAVFVIANVIAYLIAGNWVFAFWGAILGDIFSHKGNDTRAKVFGIIALILIVDFFLNGHGAPILGIHSVNNISANPTVRYHLTELGKGGEEVKPQDSAMVRLGNFLGQGEVTVIPPTDQEVAADKAKAAASAKEKEEFVKANTIKYPSWWHFILALAATLWAIGYYIVSKREELMHDLQLLVNKVRRKDDSEAGGTAGSTTATGTTGTARTLIGGLLGAFLTVEFLELIMNIINWWRGKKSEPAAKKTA